MSKEAEQKKKLIDGVDILVENYLEKCNSLQVLVRVRDLIERVFGDEPKAGAAEEVRRLQAIVATQGEIIRWYEEEGDRSCYNNSSIPEDLRELEQALEAVKAARGDHG